MGVASPTISERVFLFLHTTRRSPLASMATAQLAVKPASRAHPAVGDRICPGELAADPANSVIDDPRTFVTQTWPEPSTAMPWGCEMLALPSLYPLEMTEPSLASSWLMLSPM